MFSSIVSVFSRFTSTWLTSEARTRLLYPDRVSAERDRVKTSKSTETTRGPRVGSENRRRVGANPEAVRVTTRVERAATRPFIGVDYLGEMEENMMDGIGVGDSFALAIAFSVVVGVGWTWIKKRRQPDTAGALLALSARLDEERRRDRERKAAARDSVDDLGARDLEAAIQDARDFEKSGASQNAGLEGDGDEEEIDLKDLDAETAELEMFAAAGRDGSG